MIVFFEAVRDNPLLLSAIIAGLAASVVSGIIGSYVVVKRIGFISGAIAHSVLGGIGVSLWLERVHNLTWMSPLYGALAAAICSAFFIGWIRLYYSEREDSVIAMIWSVGMAIGIIFATLTPGYSTELTNFLIGNILWVSHHDLMLLLTIDIIVVLAVLCLHKRFLAICFDEQQAQLQGLKVNTLYLLLLVLTAVTVVLLVHVVGIVLVITMLTIPAAIANLFTGRLSRMMLFAIGFNALFCLSGTATAYHLDWPAGATIALVASCTYIGLLGLSPRN
jgi:zinc transport system permease protein